MPDTEKLRSMLDNLINDKAEDAQINFHDYLQDKMKDVAGTQPAEQPDNEE